MPVGGEALLCGEYTAVYNSVSLGIFQADDGLPTLIPMPRSKAVNRTSKYGYSKLTSVGMGIDWTLEMICMEPTKAYSFAAASALWPFAALGKLGVIGLFKDSVAQAVVLTAIAGTSASNAPATLTAPKCAIADDFQSKIVFGPDLRVVPLKFDLYLATLVDSSVGHFSTT